MLSGEGCSEKLFQVFWARRCTDSLAGIPGWEPSTGLKSLKATTAGLCEAVEEPAARSSMGLMLDDGPLMGPKAFDDGVEPCDSARAESGHRHQRWLSTIYLLHCSGENPRWWMFFTKHLGQVTLIVHVVLQQTLKETSLSLNFH